MLELKALFGLVAVVASIVVLWIFLPRNGEEHPLTAKPYFSAFIVPLIMAGAVLGIAFFLSALV
jgi:hypothetical protein